MWKHSMSLPPGVCHVARVMEAEGAVTGFGNGHFLALEQLKGALGGQAAGPDRQVSFPRG